MKRIPDNQINASFIDISRIKWLVFFYCSRLSSAQRDHWHAPKQRPIIDRHPVEQIAYWRDIKDNGYKSVFTNSWLIRQRNRWWIKGLGTNPQKTELIHWRQLVPFVRGPLNHVPSYSEKHLHVYTSSRTMSCHVWRVDTAPDQTRNKMECVLRRPPIRGWKKKIAGLYGIRCELVKKKSDNSVLSKNHPSLTHDQYLTLLFISSSFVFISHLTNFLSYSVFAYTI